MSDRRQTTDKPAPEPPRHRVGRATDTIAFDRVSIYAFQPPPVSSYIADAAKALPGGAPWPTPSR